MKNFLLLAVFAFLFIACEKTDLYDESGEEIELFQTEKGDVIRPGDDPEEETTSTSAQNDSAWFGQSKEFTNKIYNC
ncbi:hypothetical protein [Aquimarina intermedia]|uniref:Uncharacterized protein n=1 Tax=Aquimarina intermedia TaxID=350814 RepID=A0A5S5C0Q0_9FLAO|nr:hypothetical protein [Aquimarina intermedia]TYP71533.1 hypothetical protein BD809_109115 [Aquimarina intermedia]